MNVVIVVAAALLLGAAAVTCVRLLRGPSVLDRVAAVDMLLAIVVCALGAAAAWTRDSTLVPLLVVVALLGFVGSATVARILGRRP